MTGEDPAYQLKTIEKLQARVVTPGRDPMLHGFDVERDLAKSFTFGEVVLLALTGEEPDPLRARAFEAAMTFLAAVSVAEAPAHAAVLARTCGSPAAPLVGTVAITAAERARAIVEAHRDPTSARSEGEEDRQAERAASEASGDGCEGFARARPDDRQAERAASEASGDGCEGFARAGPDDRRSLAALVDAIGAGAPEFLQQPMTRMAALIVLLRWCGLDTEEKLVAALSIAALPASIAEGLAARPLSFGDYPLRLPEFEYREP